MQHVVAVADIGQFEVIAELCLLLCIGQQIGERLDRMLAVAQRIDDGNGRVVRKFCYDFMLETFVRRSHPPTATALQRHPPRARACPGRHPPAQVDRAVLPAAPSPPRN